LGLGLFDTDPQRLLSLLHHQSALAEEALRYRSVLFGAGVGSPSASLGAAQPGVGFLPLLDDYKEPLNLHSAAAAAAAAAAEGSIVPAGAATPTSGSPFDLQLEVTTKTATATTKTANTIRVRDGLLKEGYYDDGEELLLRKPSALVSAAYGLASASCSSSASSSSLCDPESLALFRGGSPTAAAAPITTTTATTTATATMATPGDTKCHICMANFPSAWLLEQHAALQHPHLTIHDDKPYLCGLCGQKSRYACCRYRTVLSKHHRAEPGGRSRVPADKLFTCDVCGMQFRYLKSFKKHRLNHALERLHGKKGVVPAGPGSVDSEPAVSSTNEGGGAEASSSSSSSSSGLALADLQHGPPASEPDTAREHEEQDDTVSDSARKPSPPAAAHRHASVVRSMEAESSGLLQHCIAPSTSASSAAGAAVAAAAAVAHATGSSAPGSLSHTLNSLINAETIPHHRLLGLDPQEASILNFLRVDAAEKQRDRRFACPFCGKCVRSKENLKLHVRKHTGERPFVCLFCGRAFGGKSDLTRHLRIHTGERPYHCEACGKCFARADYLSKHLTTHVHQLSPRP
uniref:C2H2-type domain-containing protein n=1 Tax=Anopheles atroparvus TaxID=41427 RepID=A0A182IYW3_ANOAO